MKCRFFGLFLLVSMQVNAVTVFSDTNPPGKWTHEEVAAGSLDSSFSSDGKVTTAIGSGNDSIWGVAIQPDGKIVVAGESHNGSNDDLVVARYNSDGSLDMRFGDSGQKITTFGSSEDHGYGVVIQPDGKIVVAGDSNNGSNYDFAVVRYNSDGSLDATFNSTGKVTTAIGSGHDIGRSIALQPDGKIVVAGYSHNGSDYDFAVVRYNSDGSLDTTFNSTGKVTTDISGATEFGYGVVIQPDGKIVVAGASYNGSDYDFAVVRYNSDGSLDTTLNSTGKVTTAVGASNDYGREIALQPDGKIIVAGYSDNGSNDVFAVVRYNSDGSLDTTFNSTGKVTTVVGSNDSFGYTVLLQSDGKIIVAGRSNNGSDNDFAVVRYNSDGSLDTTFDSDGKIATDFGSGADSVYALALQSDGKIVASGLADNGSNTDFALTRYSNNIASLKLAKRDIGFVA